MLVDNCVEFIIENLNLSIVVSAWSLMVIYYFTNISKLPTLAAGIKFRQFLVTYCPIVNEKFSPTFWCYSARAQTILRQLIKSSPLLSYERELLNLSDGGHVALDWMLCGEDSKSRDDGQLNAACRHIRKQPIVIILPGLIGSSQESYVTHLVIQAKSHGYRSVVFNNRGNGGAGLKTSRTYSATNTEDLSAVISHIRLRYPVAPLMAVGISLGGIILANYLSRTGKSCDLIAAMSVSSAWNVFESAKTLEEPFNSFLFNRHLTKCLKAAVRRHEELFRDEYDLSSIYQSQSIREFDDRFTSKQFGYATWREYYEDACIHEKIHRIQIPFLCLNSADDPFSPKHAIPLVEAGKSNSVAILMTEFGGHIGFMEGIFPRYASYMDRLFIQYADAIFNHQNELDLLTQ